MPLDTYGIYIGYPPTVDLRNQGLGRYLASFLKGAADRPDVEFIILCPSWSHQMLDELFRSEAVPLDHFRILSPKGKPYLLRIFEAYQRFGKKPKRIGILDWLGKLGRTQIERITHHFEARMARMHSVATALPLLLDTTALIFFVVITFPLWALGLLSAVTLKSLQKFLRPIANTLKRPIVWIEDIIKSPQEDTWVLRTFAKISAMESERMLKQMDGLHEVRAWYSPTAFWPEFNQFEGPSVVCVPDVVLTQFPVGFSTVGGERYLETFETIKKTIHTAKYMVTYSNSVKWDTLVDRYAVEPDRVRVIHHAPQSIDYLVNISDSSDSEAVSHYHCQNLLIRAFDKSLGGNPSYAPDFKNGSVKFLFYASQFRPNKNIISLLRAYEYLLHKRFIRHKLILTGDPRGMPEFEEFITKHNLRNDVLCLHDLTSAQLAACYKLADIAVNPSLSEGGCPFTFSEALSVNTPVLMSRIAVTEEVLSDPDLQEISFFDPYDWEDIARQIEWGIANQDSLLQVQRKAYQIQAQRTWADVANEHIDFLQDISKR